MFSSSQLLYLALIGTGSNKMQAEILQILWRLSQRGPVIPVTSTEQQDACHILKGSVYAQEFYCYDYIKRFM